MNLKIKGIKNLSVLLAVICTVSVIFSSCTSQQEDIPEPQGYYYQTLDENEKGAYKSILQNIKEHPQRISVGQVDAEQMERIIFAVEKDYPTLLCIESGTDSIGSLEKGFFTNYYVPTYQFSLSECQHKGEELAQAVQKLVEGAGGTEGEKLLYYHDAIIDGCVYSNTGEKNEKTAYGALCGGKADCVGYTLALKTLLDESGIESFAVTGTTDGADFENHIWNVVKIDGAFYHVDVTWDDPVLEDGGQVCNRAYFRLSDDEISADHVIAESGTGYCTNSGFEFSDLYGGKIGENVREDMITALTTAFSNDEEHIELFFINRQAYKTACEYFDSDVIFDIMDAACRRSGASHWGEIEFSRNDARMIIDINF